MYKIKKIFLLSLLALLIFGLAHAEEWGEFRGVVEARWEPDGRTMTLLRDFAYIDPTGEVWVAPLGSVVDGASIPIIAWQIIGPPFVGLYREASVIHDVACDRRERTWEETHEAFYSAMRNRGVSVSKAKLMYAAVYHAGPRWLRKIERKNISKLEAESTVELVRMESDHNSKIESTILPSKDSRATPGAVDLELLVEPAPGDMTEDQLQIINNQLKANDLSLRDIRQLEF
jgi:hypothetical protein